MSKKKIIESFRIPEEGYGIIDCILNGKEQDFLQFAVPDREYTKEELGKVILKEHICEDMGEADGFIDTMFGRGVISRGEDGISYKIAGFYTRLDIFATQEREAYDRLDRSQKEALDHWYFQAYLDSLGSRNNPFPTKDEVLPLWDVLDFIEKREDTPYLADCDCRRLIQNCSNPTDTCITYRTAPNSFVKRGLAMPITKEEAKEIVKKADKQGLVHTVNPGGICNCCTDCCYLFRAGEARNSRGIWPRVHYVISLDKEKCIDCMACRRRCPFGVFNQDGSLGIERVHACQGCGLCVTGCPTKALELMKVTG